MNTIKAVLAAAALAVITYGTVEAARRLHEAWGTDAELAARRAITRAKWERSIDEAVRRGTPFVLWEAFCAKEGIEP